MMKILKTPLDDFLSQDSYDGYDYTPWQINFRHNVTNFQQIEEYVFNKDKFITSIEESNFSIEDELLTNLHIGRKTDCINQL